MKPVKLTLTAAMCEWMDMQATVGNDVILVRDFNCYDDGGYIVKVNGEEGGLDNAYTSADEIEQDLAILIPGYVTGAAIWEEDDKEME